MTISDTITAIVFDYGGVLDYPLDPKANDANIKALAKQHDMSADELTQYLFDGDDWRAAEIGEISRREFWNRRLEPLGITAESQQIRFERQFFKGRSQIHPILRALLMQLRNHYQIGILSNANMQDFAGWLAERAGRGDLFDYVFGSADIGLAKPDPAIFEYISQQMQQPLESILFIDDSPDNVESALSAGVHAVHFETPEALEKWLKQNGFLSHD